MSCSTPGPEPLPAAFVAALRGLLGEAALLTDPADCLTYGYDNSRRLTLPQAVAFAQNHEQVQAVVRLCHQYRVPLTARGRGTNTTGASVPLAGGLVLSLERMDRILEVSPGDRLLRCEAGALNGAVQAAAGRHGLFWAPDPTSAAFSTVGGNLACGAGGPRAVKYGTARDAVLGLKAVTGEGRTLTTGAYTSKSVVGYDLSRLLIGSEGTLAIITEATLKLLPRPSQTRLLRAAYADVTAAAEAVARIMGQPAIPSALEFLDGEAVRLAEEYRPTGVPAGTGALLLIEADGEAETLPATVRAIEAAASGAGLVELRSAGSAEEAETLWACRKALSPSLRKLAPKKVNEDVAVPVTQLPALIAGVQALSRAHGLPIVCFGHAGNGNIHVNLLANPDDPAQMGRIEACLAALFRLVLSLRGTLSGEHGVGIDKRDYVGWEVDADTLEQMRAVKQLFDPLGILNPGKALPTATGI
ncbi:FAD-binding protein [Stagnimonas aquatica]|uniref:FAD-binding protein n=1 Tax=Stagnimonas aquatica TaxID=2689987 RepID=A0A3N0VH20_9GAMM|nr:FAD-linked oxidase C-terminal domain-containing protein [Stagnimonas aquatica]ROH91971.1 FAD-binding protein [Stagnimonas aquatica]